MRISFVFSALILTIGLFATAKSGMTLVEASRDYQRVGQLSELAEARTAWIDGTVALSLERSVTQVALALDEPAPQALVDLINQQRQLSDRLFNSTKRQLDTIRELPSQSKFATQASELRAQVGALRDEVDIMLANGSAKRRAARAYNLPFELKEAISSLKNLSDLMIYKNNLTSSQAASLSILQERAWEIREFGGRARTYYAIATLTGRPFDAQTKAAVAIENTRSFGAWQNVDNTLANGEVPPELQQMASAAQAAYFGTYIDAINTLDAEMTSNGFGDVIDYSISFDSFFQLSSDALGQAAGLSKEAGAALLTYWGKRRTAAWNSLVINGVILALVVALVLGALIIVRKRVTSRLEAVTEALVATSNGDFENSVEKRKNDLREIGDLATSLGDLSRMLATADTAKQQQEADQEVQARVVSELSTGLRQMSDGNLGHTISAPFGGRYETLRGDYHASCERLRQLVGSVVESSQQINTSSHEVQGATSDLARRTENQAASLEETVAALDELATGVKATAQGAGKADEFVLATKDHAEKGGVIVHQAVDAMQQIKASSDEISQIIGLIDDIAFQTNLLALNAGVEAARAGEAGRGFAVVASEVRALAQRATEAAKQISDLINSSSQHVQRGVSLVSDTGTSLTQIVGMVEEISGLVSEISTASKNQASNLSEVNVSVTQLDRVTQQNAGMVQQLSAASSETTKGAEALKRSTKLFSFEGDAQQSTVQAVPFRRSA